MKLSPLQVKHYHFTELSVAARSAIDIEKLDYGTEPYPPTDEANLQTVVELGEPDGEPDPHQFVVTLSISSHPDKASNFPYIFAAKLEGVFTFDHSGELEERKRLVVCNGASILYSAAREQLLAITARLKFGPMLLPTASFNGMAPASKKVEKKATKSRRATGKPSIK